MKSLILALALTTSVSALADVSCTGIQDGRDIEFVISTSATNTYTGIKAIVDGKEFASFKGNNVRVSQHVYGTVVEGFKNAGSALDRLMVLIAKPGTGTNEGWITFYGTLSVSGVDLDCTSL